MKQVRTRLLAAAAALAAGVASDARPQNRSAPLILLDVPYVSQSEALCGGAAAAMVMRYWGATGVYAESFADLVSPAEGGIRGDDLLRSLKERGWDARSFRGDAALVREQLARHRPVVALIEDRPGRFHYVVLVAWADGRVLLHDPARAPFRVIADSEFSQRWNASGYWTMLLLPGEGGAPAAPDGTATASAPPAAASTPCAAMIEEGVRLAGRGEGDAARRLFEMSAVACPSESGPWREIAGLHALQREWRDAARHAARAVRLDPQDQHAWRILATATYLDGQQRAALDAWNRIGEPRVDLVAIRGLERTRYDVIAGVVGIRPQTLLTRGSLDRARRRLEEVPAVQTSRVFYRPGENGQAQVEAVVFERPMLPTSTPSLIAAGVRMLSDRELAAALSSPGGGGEVWDASWRWWENRPRVALGFAAPAPSGGVVRVEAFDEQQTYGAAGALLKERRRGASFSLADWLGADTRWQVGVGFDRWRSRGDGVSLGGSIERHLAGDALVLSTRGTTWFGSVATWTAHAGLDWRTSRAHEAHVWLARAGVHAAGDRAPLALWSGAGTGPRAEALLRAHPIIDDGRVDRAVFGRRLVYAGAEWRRWLPPVKRVIRLAPAVFVDAARAIDGAPFSDVRGHVDVGAGIRFVLPGAGVVGIDVGRGLRDGRTAASIGFRR